MLRDRLGGNGNDGEVACYRHFQRDPIKPAPFLNTRSQSRLLGFSCSGSVSDVSGLPNDRVTVCEK